MATIIDYVLQRNLNYSNRGQGQDKEVLGLDRIALICAQVELFPA
jgi:hypothetical protein